MALIKHDLTKIDAIRAKYLYDVLETVQVKSYEIAAQRRLASIKK